jgi:hypothetical protein
LIERVAQGPCRNFSENHKDKIEFEQKSENTVAAWLTIYEPLPKLRKSAGVKKRRETLSQPAQSFPFQLWVTFRRPATGPHHAQWRCAKSAPKSGKYR